MRMRFELTALVLLAACAPSARAAHASVPAGIVIPADARPGQDYRGMEIGSNGDRGVWLLSETTLTLRMPRPGKRLVFIMYEPDDRARTVAARIETQKIQRRCCLRKGIGEIALDLDRADRNRRVLTVYLHVAPVETLRRAVILVRAFRY